jgi:hypothetical protein
MSTPDDDQIDTVMQDDYVGRPIRVMWIDSGLACDGWRTPGELPAMVETVESVGLWMGENDQVVMIGGTRDSQNNGWLHCQLIWKTAIQSTEWLT